MTGKHNMDAAVKTTLHLRHIFLLIVWASRGVRLLFSERPQFGAAPQHDV